MLPPDCEAALDQLDAFRRGELDAGDMLSLQHHLEECRRCYAFNQHEAAFLDRLISAARNCSCPDELRAAVYQIIAKESRDN
jgi:DNA-binding FrmR family transcriptional regulator